MRPTTAPDQGLAFDLDALVHPGTIFNQPKDVVADPVLTHAAKRAILASWASDASATPSCTALRTPAGLIQPVSIDEIIDALAELDDDPRGPPGGHVMRTQPITRLAA